jgi:hypothetical protein
MLIDDFIKELKSEVEKEEDKYDAVVNHKDYGKFILYKKEDAIIKNIPHLFKIGFSYNNMWHRFDISKKENFNDNGLMDFLNPDMTIKETNEQYDKLKTKDIYSELFDDSKKSTFDSDRQDTLTEEERTNFIGKIKMTDKTEVVNNEERVRKNHKLMIDMGDKLNSVKEMIYYLHKAAEYIKICIEKKTYYDVPVKVNIEEIKRFVLMCDSVKGEIKRETAFKKINEVFNEDIK